MRRVRNMKSLRQDCNHKRALNKDGFMSQNF